MKIKSTQVKTYREKMLAEQNYKCGLCGLPITEDDRVHLDHCHKNGWVRGALHARCNTLLSKVENNAKRMGFKSDEELKAFLLGVYDYLSKHQTDQTGLLHPTHRTDEEKKALAKARRKARLNTRLEQTKE